MVDLHNHMLPELDDGARSWNDALAMARAAAADGISGVVCTPHWMLGRYDNDVSVVTAKVRELRRVLKQQRIRLQVHPGSEVRIDPTFLDGIDWGRLLTLNNNGRYALIELPMHVHPGTLEPVFNAIQRSGVVPVIAHPERYPWAAAHLDRFGAWLHRGILFQVTAASLLGQLGRECEQLSIELLRRGWVQVLATDSHGVKLRAPILSRARDRATQLVGARRARRLVSDNPRRILAGLLFPPAAEGPQSRRHPQPLFTPTTASLSTKLKGRSN